MPKLSLPGLALAGLVLSLSPSSASQIVHEDFASDPGLRGWQTHGEASLFAWNATGQNLRVTWDSSRTNSYFHRSLGTDLTRHDDSSLAFDLRLSDLAIGTTPGKEFTFQIALGFLNGRDATQPGFLRGTGLDSPNLVEFDYFPDSGFGATVSPTIISSNMVFASGFNAPLALTTNDWFHVTMRYTASDQTLVTTMTRNGTPFGPIESVTLTNQAFTDFHVDQFAISSFSDFGQDPDWDGSILAHGEVDNIELILPDPPVAVIRGEPVAGHWTAAFTSQTNWVYTLEATQEFASWQTVSAPAAGTGGVLSLSDTHGLGGRAFYRVLAERP